MPTPFVSKRVHKLQAKRKQKRQEEAAAKVFKLHRSLREVKELLFGDNDKDCARRQGSVASTPNGELTKIHQEKLLEILNERYDLSHSTLVDIGSGSGQFL